MTLKISYNAALMLNAIVRNPGILPLSQVGMANAQGLPMPYRPNKEEAKRLKSIAKVFEADLMHDVKRDKFGNVTAGDIQEPGEVVELKLANSYVKTLETALKHYEPVASVLDWTERYVALEAALAGKDVSKEYDDLEDVRGHDKKEEPVKPEEPKKEKTA